MCIFLLFNLGEKLNRKNNYNSPNWITKFKKKTSVPNRIEYEIKSKICHEVTAIQIFF